MSTLQAVRYHDGERYMSALLKLGHKRLHAVVIDDVGVRVLHEPKENARHCEPLLRRGEPYPIERMLKHFRRVGRERGISQEAKAIIEEVLT